MELPSRGRVDVWLVVCGLRVCVDLWGGGGGGDGDMGV